MVDPKVYPWSQALFKKLHETLNDLAVAWRKGSVMVFLSRNMYGVLALHSTAVLWMAAVILLLQTWTKQDWGGEGKLEQVTAWCRHLYNKIYLNFLSLHFLCTLISCV